MRADEEILKSAADKITQILRIPHTNIDTLKFVILFSVLYIAVGQGEDGEENMRWWLNTYNKSLGYCPAARLTDEYYLDKTIAYLESFVNE